MLNSAGKVVETFSGHGINGPWDMTAVNFGSVAELFVTNVLNGTVAAALAAGITPSTTPGPTVNKGTVLRLLVTTPSKWLRRSRGCCARTWSGPGSASGPTPPPW